MVFGPVLAMLRELLLALQSGITPGWTIWNMGLEIEPPGWLPAKQVP